MTRRYRLLQKLLGVFACHARPQALSLMRMNKVDTLSIAFSMPDGVDGTDQDPNNPISRALDSLLRTGKPIDKLTQCHFEDTITLAGRSTRSWFMNPCSSTWRIVPGS